MGPPTTLPGEKSRKKKKPHPTGFLMWTAGGPSRNQSLKSGKKPESSNSGGVSNSSEQRSASSTRASKAERPSAPNGSGLPRPSAPNGKAEAGKAGEGDCVVM
jgi:hypothetical protein